MSSEKLVSHWLPCPVVFVSVASGEKRDIMTATAMFVSEGEPILAISVAKGHLTHRLIAEAKTFTLSIASESQRALALQLGSMRGDEEDKFRRFSIETIPNQSGKAIIPKGASAWMECNVIGDQEVDGYHLLIARVVAQGDLGDPPMVWRGNAFFGLKAV
jgi:flavin reductase (DIM6/NTAB) family NADH-FMN oxidoreductase RutF